MATNIETGLTVAPALSPEQVTAIVEWFETFGKSRKAEQKRKFSEADFIAGAMLAFFACGCENKIPPRWLFEGPMVGRSLFK